MATNRIDILDSALLRPGRIDRKIEFPPPSEIVSRRMVDPNYFLKASLIRLFVLKSRLVPIFSRFIPAR